MTTLQPTVSVIVPSYNHGAFVAAALESVCAQTWKALDVIVIDDGSTDDTASILKPWMQRGVRVVCQDHEGASAARNRGIGLARGEFVVFIDADDLWPWSGMIEAALGWFAAHPESAWTFGDAQPFEDLATQRVLTGPPYLQSGGYYRTPSDDAEIRQLTPGDLCNNDRFFIPTGTLVIRKRCFDEVGGFDDSLRMFEDTDMWLRLLRYPVGFFPKVLLLRRIHGDNISHRRWAHLDDLSRLFKRYDLAAHGVSFDFHAARAHYGAGREAFRQRRFADAARAFRSSLGHRVAWRPSVLYLAAALAARWPTRGVNES